jgi:hypothetical protein
MRLIFVLKKETYLQKMKRLVDYDFVVGNSQTVIDNADV